MRTVPTPSGTGIDAAAHVTFTPVSVPGVTQTPQFALRLRAPHAVDELLPASVQVLGDGVVLAEVDVAGGFVYVNVTASPGAGGVMSFVVTATLSH